MCLRVCFQYDQGPGQSSNDVRCGAAAVCRRGERRRPRRPLFEGVSRYAVGSLRSFSAFSRLAYTAPWPRVVRRTAVLTAEKPARSHLAVRA